jgi:predicted amidophosphoribosyltransferase
MSLLLRIFSICCAFLIIAFYFIFSHQDGFIFTSPTIVIPLLVIVVAIAIVLTVSNTGKQKCPFCERKINKDNTFCSSCGTNLKSYAALAPSFHPDATLTSPSISSMQTVSLSFLKKECYNCHKKTSQGESFCGYCGHPQAILK